VILRVLCGFGIFETDRRHIVAVVGLPNSNCLNFDWRYFP
jgi:hypothetical protein